MEAKPYQIKMNPKAHARLKMRASQLQITIGEMIENLLASFEMRLKRNWENINNDGSIRSLSVEEELTRLLLEKDCEDISEEEFNRQIETAVDMEIRQQWKPEIKTGTIKKEN